MSEQSAHFLLVEDDDAHATLVQMCLEELDGDTVSHVRDGDEALAFLQRLPPFESAERPDVIMLDLKLPRRDGHEVLAQVKADPALRTIPVVILTTSASRSDHLRAYTGYANSILTKPADFGEFRNMIACLRNYWGVLNQRLAQE